MRIRFLMAGTLIALCIGTGLARGAEPQGTALRAGVATQVITPAESMWMAGYGARTKPSEGKATELFDKALALEDAAGMRLVIVNLDLVGLPRDLHDLIEKPVEE